MTEPIDPEPQPEVCFWRLVRHPDHYIEYAYDPALESCDEPIIDEIMGGSGCDWLIWLGDAHNVVEEVEPNFPSCTLAPVAVLR